MKVLERRNTKQREIIFNALRNNYTHPTANEVYDIVHQKYPYISVSTVYRNLDILAKKDKILKILIPTERFARYDFQTHKHYHIKCNICGKVEDLNFGKFNCTRRLKTVTDFEEVNCTIDFTGVCKSCASKKLHKNNKSTTNGEINE